MLALFIRRGRLHYLFIRVRQDLISGYANCPRFFLSGIALSLILNIYCYEDKNFYDDGVGYPADRG